MVAQEILRQLGGNKFVAMTGSRNFLLGNRSLTMELTRNKSGANRLEIKLDPNDTYTMRFIRFTPSRIDVKVGIFTNSKITEVQKVEGIYFDQLQRIFTQITGLYTNL